MILTVTLNPAVDKTYETGELLPGHVNRMRSVVKLAGGKGVNVTRILRQYGFDVCATGFLGGYAGRFITDTLREAGAECRFIQVDGETRSNMNILADNGFVTEILEPGPQIPPEKVREFLDQYDELLAKTNLVIISGSAACGVDAGIYGTLIEKASARSIPTFLDASGEGLAEGMKAHPTFVKPNQKELEYLAGRRLPGREACADAALMLAADGIAHVVVSMGSKGLLSVEEGQVLYASAASVKAVNTVACGDSVVAAYAMSFLEGKESESAIRLAAAIAGANATTRESAQIPKELAKELEQNIKVEILL